MKKIFDMNKSESLNLCLLKIIIIVLCSFLILSQLSCKKQTPPPSQTTQSQSETSSEPKPPDLSKCTRIEMEFYPSTKDYFLLMSLPLSFNSQEIEYLESIDKLSFTDPKVIKAFSEDISSSTFNQKVPGAPGIGNYIGIDCYYKDVIQTHIMVYPSTSNYGLILINRNYEFITKINLNLLAPEIQKYMWRFSCARNLKEYLFNLFRNYSKGSFTFYPAPSKWCDEIIESYKQSGYSSNISEFKRVFTCPCKAEAKCNYAMNPNCNPESPYDMVLLFETKDGWNQYGGPELFTFENHDPKGGCVLLKNGIVKFIKTEEELNSLKWK